MTATFSLVLDAHALSELAADARSMRTWMALVDRTGSELYVSTATLTEVADGSARDARMRRALRNLNPPIPPSEAIAFDAGRLRAATAGSRRKPRDLTVDAIVAATALTLRPPVIVLTSDKGDLDRLLDGSGVDVRLVS